MGLYLAIFRGDEELDGVEVGAYADFGAFRDAVTNLLESGSPPGSRFPTLILHSDCDGQWSPAECSRLVDELSTIAEAFRRLPPRAIKVGWMVEVAAEKGQPSNLYDCFFDVDGEPLIDRLANLAKVGVKHGLPILFQ